MSTEAPARPKKATWVDWVREGAPDPRPEELITRDELIDELHRWGVPITTRELRYWEAEGALPRPVRRSHEGLVRAVYPTWVRGLVPHVRARRQRGVPLPEIGAQLRQQLSHEATAEEAERALLLGLITLAGESALYPEAYGVDLSDPEELAVWDATEGAAVRRALGFTDDELGDVLDTILNERVRRLREATGRRVGSIDIVFRDKNEQALATMTRYPR